MELDANGVGSKFFGFVAKNVSIGLFFIVINFFRRPVHPRTARLTDEDLRDGLHILILMDGQFWPATVTTTQLPDVYAVHVAKGRGNRPLILPRDDILKDVVSLSRLE